MAEKRMFSKTIIDSDAFLDMPLSTQSLYFHLSMRADDDGFINNPKKIQRMIGCSDDDFKLLIAKQFVIPFESGIIVIKHWKMHNYIQKDRYKPTLYQNEKRMLNIENNTYSLIDTECIQNVYKMDTQVRLDKVRLELDKDKDIEENDEENTSLQIKDLRLRYSKDELSVIDNYFDILRWTRKNGRIADSVILKIYTEWEKFSIPKVIHALKVYINNPKYHDKKENYCYGIMRNSTSEEIENKAQNPKKEYKDDNPFLNRG